MGYSFLSSLVLKFIYLFLLLLFVCGWEIWVCMFTTWGLGSTGVALGPRHPHSTNVNAPIRLSFFFFFFHFPIHADLGRFRPKLAEMLV